MSLVDIWFAQAVQRTYGSWLTSRHVPPAEQQLARHRVTQARRVLSQLDTQAMPAIR